MSSCYLLNSVMCPAQALCYFLFLGGYEAVWGWIFAGALVQMHVASFSRSF